MTQHFTITVEAPDALGLTTAGLERAVLEHIEPGASTHCMGRESGTHAEYVTHVRLGVTIGTRVVYR